MPDPTFDAYQLSPRLPPAPRASLARILAIAVSLNLHLAGLGWLLFRTIEPMPRSPPPTSSTDSGMLLVLVAPAPVLPTAVPPEAARPGVLSQVPPGAASSPEHADSRPPTRPTARAVHLFEAMPAAASAQVRSDAPHPQQATPAVPGRAEAFIDLPVRFRPKPSPAQIVAAVGRFIGAGQGYIGAGQSMADDNFRGGPDDSDPLVHWTNERMRDAVDPVCNDPEHPRIDDRCLKKGE